VRIGVNTGGPILAGVIDNEKPTFDIIGDTINVSARLRITCIVGHIQIPQSVYDLISGLDYRIEKRSEIFLKGKENTTTYLIYRRQRLAREQSKSLLKSLRSVVNVC
jgi:adenylate cyclase